MKKINSYFSIFLLAFTLLLISPALLTEASSKGSCGEKATWELSDDGVLTISGSGKIHGVAWAKQIADIRSVVIHEGITSIGESAFLGATNLTTVSLPDSLTEIDNYSFNKCVNLTSVKLPAKLERLGINAFGYCFNLTSIHIPKSLTNVSNSPFYLSGLKKVTFDNGITYIPSNICSYCYQLESVTIPSSVTAIGRKAFHCCTALSSIKLPDKLKTIHMLAFSNCWSLKSIHLPATFKGLPTSAFIDINYDAGDDSEYTYYGPFEYSGIEQVTFGNGIKTIPSYVFQECRKLKKIVIPNSVTTIQQNAFYNCKSLTSLIIPYTCTKINKTSISGSGIKTIYGIKNSAAHKLAKQKKITFKEYHFQGATYTVGKGYYKITKDLSKNGTVAFVKPLKTSYTSFTIPSKVKIAGRTYQVTSIEKNAFKNNKKLKQIKMQSATITSIGTNAFKNIKSNATILVPNSKLNAYRKLFTKNTGYLKSMKIKKY